MQDNDSLYYNDMKKNLNLPDNIQYFGDSIYEYIPPQHKGMKLFVLLCYNQKYNKTLLCLLALIYNENKEILKEIFKFLKLNYEFYTKLITVDFGKAGYMMMKIMEMIIMIIIRMISYMIMLIILIML